TIGVSGSQPFGLSIPAQILGDGGFTKTGTRGLRLSGNNIFNGDITVSQGVLAAAHGNALGTVAGFTYVSNSAVLRMESAAIYGESLFARGTVPRLEGTGSNIWSGPVILDSTLDVFGLEDGTINLNGLVS